MVTYLTARDALVVHFLVGCRRARVLALFDVAANPSLGNRVQTLATRLRAG